MPVLKFEEKLADVSGPKKIGKWIAEDMRKTAFKPEVKKDADKTTRGWTGEKPTFVLLIRETPRNVFVFTLFMRGTQYSKDKWNWLDRGTPPHPITPKKKGGRLRYRPGYKRGSKPKRLITYRAKRSGAYTYRKAVSHPGTGAVDFRGTLRKKHQKTFSKKYRAAQRRAIKRSGHSKK